MVWFDAERLLLLGRSRVVITGLVPVVDAGRFPIKRVLGEDVLVRAAVFADGHDVLAVVLQHRPVRESEWREVPMEPLGNDGWSARFTPAETGPHTYAVIAWVDAFATWRRDLEKRLRAGQDVSIPLLEGAQLAEHLAPSMPATVAGMLREWSARLREPTGSAALIARLALDPEVARAASAHAPRLHATRSPELGVVVDRERARFSTWYELFPRSASPVAGRHGTFADCAARLPYIASMGFDVVYLPPIHPIGHTNRKGRNNATVAAPGDPGSPWAIGSEAGGHQAIHPELGTLDDLTRLLARARELGMEIALDLAFQCSPDHPYVRDHREWFRTRPDGSVQYAENPPKKYEDIYPFDFECEGHRGLWAELLRVVEFWVAHGVRIFRVDNPHTKPLRLWEWLIGTVKAAHPDVLFLAEAFTRPHPMLELAKRGFTQSYTYFTWRQTKPELTAYFTELAQDGVREYFRPNLWPNTPDILPEHLQLGGRPAFMARLVLAATLGASYGIYGPPFELCVAEARAPASEEYRDSEKYEIRTWNLDDPQSLRHFVARVNRIRRENPALQRDTSLHFHEVDHERLIAYSKQSPDHANTILTVVNLDPHHKHGGWLTLDLESLGVPERQAYQAHDLLSDARFSWHGPRNYVELDPNAAPAHVFVIRHRARSEQDFDYFL